jgi:hypothetical protein
MGRRGDFVRIKKKMPVPVTVYLGPGSDKFIGNAERDFCFPGGARRNRCVGRGNNDACITGNCNSDCVGGGGNDYCHTAAAATAAGAAAARTSASWAKSRTAATAARDADPAHERDAHFCIAGYIDVC